MRRGLSHLEAAVALVLALVLIPAVLPSPRSELEAVRGAFEAETARLLLEGELSLAREAALVGTLEAGQRDADGARWRGATRLPDLRLEWRVVPSGSALWEVEVSARWRSVLDGGDRELTLGTLLPRSAP